MKKNIIIDVDGVMTTGQFIYSKTGKLFKIFGPHDTDGLNLLKKKYNISFITADKKGLEITKKETPEASNAINSLFLLKEEIEKIVAKKQLIGKSQV